jgi:PKD repeat protein
MIRNSLIILVIPFFVNGQSAFISGNDSICNNSINQAEVKVSFSAAIEPYTFVYAINGINQPSIITNVNPHVINTYTAGNYTLTSFSDANVIGSTSGSGLVTVLESPTALIHLASDTLSVAYPIANFISQSTGNIVSWDWNFGDNTTNNFSSDISHSYQDSSAIYQASLIVIDNNGCSDTATHNIWVRNEFWIYIPNSFTPDNEEPNNKFCIEYNGIRENTFLFKVFNSQGSLMFQSTNSSELRCRTGGGWNGEYLQDNMNLPLDVYVYEIYFQDFEGWKHQEYGTINLVR